jgi:hypothetical protein
MEAAAKKYSYLRAIPFCSPEEQAAQIEKLRGQTEMLEAQSARWRRWTYRIVAGAAGAVVVAVVAIVFALNRPATEPAAAGAANDPLAVNPPKKYDNTSAKDNGAGAPVVTANNAGAKPAPADVKPVNSAPAKPAPAKDVKSVNPAPAKAAPSAQEIAQRGALLEAIGSLSAAHLYQTCLNVALLAECVEAKSLSLAQAKKELGFVVTLLVNVDSKLARLEKTKLEPDDQQSLKTIKATTASIRLQVEALAAYWDNDTAENAATYQKANTAAWNMVTSVLKIDDK